MQLRKVRGHCMRKEMPVILVNRVVDPKRIIGKNGGPRRRRGTRGRWPKRNLTKLSLLPNRQNINKTLKLRSKIVPRARPFPGLATGNSILLIRFVGRSETGWPGTDFMITIFCDFWQFSTEKMAFFSKTNVMINFFQNLALLWVKKSQYFRWIFRQNYLKNRNIGLRLGAFSPAVWLFTLDSFLKIK
jgi:hypothetical protein